MRKTVVICDRCNKELPETSNPGYIYLGNRDRANGDVLQDPSEFEQYDYCEDCLIDITRYIACRCSSSNTICVNNKSDNVIEMAAVEQEKNISKKKSKKESQNLSQTNSPALLTENNVIEDSEEPKKKHSRQYKIDYGKIEALANAGWSNQQIAEEMGLTAHAVSDCKYRIKTGQVVVEHEYMKKTKEEW